MMNAMCDLKVIQARWKIQQTKTKLLNRKWKGNVDFKKAISLSMVRRTTYCVLAIGNNTVCRFTKDDK